MAALSAFENRNLIVICGGYDKNLDFSPLAPVMNEKAKYVILTGACKEKIKTAFLGYKNFTTIIKEVENFDDAVLTASKCAEKGDIVLLSPAAASFDSFKNFEIRGRHYKDIVLNRI